MGWNPVKDLKQAGRSINRVAINVGRGVENVVAFPVRTTGNILRGNTAGIKKDLGKFAGSALTLNPYSQLALVDSRIKKGLESPLADTLTFGYSKNFSQSQNAFNDLSHGRSLTNAQNTQILQYGVKTGAIIGAAAYAGGAGVAKAATGKNYLGVLTAKKALSTGDVAGAVGAIGGLEGMPKGPIFDLPQLPNLEIPDWLKNIPRVVTGGSSSQAPATARFDEPMSDEKRAGISFGFMALIGLSVFIAYKKGVI